MTLEEAGIVGALGALCRLSWIFGLFPMSSSPEVKVSRWKSFYGRYGVLSYLVAIFIWKSYKWYNGSKHTNLDIVGYFGMAVMTIITVISIWNAPERTRKWLQCLKTTEKVIVRTKSVKKNEIKWTVITIGYLMGVLPLMASMSYWNGCSVTDSCTVWSYLCIWPITFPSVINVNCMMFLFNLFAARIHVAGNAMNNVIECLLNSESDEETKPRQVFQNNYISTSTHYKDSVDMSQKIRDLALTYISLCQVTETLLDTVAIILLLLLFSAIMSLMTAAVVIVDLCLASGRKVYITVCTFCFSVYPFLKLKKSFKLSGPFPLRSFILEVIWCINVMIKAIFLSEPCQLLHETMLETRELINQLKRKYSTNSKIVNELNLFQILTSLYRPTINPWDMFTFDRSLVAELSGCTITYFVAVMQLEGSQQARQA